MHDGQYCWETAAGRQTVLREAMGQTGFVMLFPLPQTVLSWQEFAGKISYVERSVIDGRPYAVLDFAYPNGALVRRWFDEESGLMTRQQIQDDGQTHALLNFDYQEIEGMQLAVGRWSNSRANKSNFEYRLDVEVDESVFEMPEIVRRQIDAK